MLQLGVGIQQKFENDFQSFRQGEEKLKIILMELGMMSDLLYTKANVLQRWIGVIFRLAAQIFTIVVFILFVKTEKHGHHNRVNVGISYTLFIGAILMEAYSVAAAIASPWTRAHLSETNFLTIHCNKWRRTSISMGQFNFTNYCITEKSNPKISKVIRSIGLEKQWRSLWYVQHINIGASNVGMVESILEFFDRQPNARFTQLHLGRKLNYTLSLPFEHALYRLHIYTDLYISRHFPCGTTYAPDVMRLKQECEKLSNYMMYLMVVHPSMLPVSTASEDLVPALGRWVRDRERENTILEILQAYTDEVLGNETYSGSPFEPDQGQPLNLQDSLEEIKEVWLRLLVYAAGKCRGELHARQLTNGGEAITFVWLLMVHHGLGDVARELRLLTSDDRYVAPVGSLVAVEDCNWITEPHGPCYAFEFSRHQHDPPIHQWSGMMSSGGEEPSSPMMLRERGEDINAASNEATTSGGAESNEAVTPLEIDG